MEKKIAGLLGAVAALGTMGAAQAAPAPVPTDALQANSYADLLQPIANASALLQALDEQQPAASRDGNIRLAQNRFPFSAPCNGKRTIELKRNKLRNIRSVEMRQKSTLMPASKTLL